MLIDVEHEKKKKRDRPGGRRERAGGALQIEDDDVELMNDCNMEGSYAIDTSVILKNTATLGFNVINDEQL